jgi:DNA-binding transcriptional LysR family regulator
VELRYLLYFATVAEQQNFTRAAEKLRIAQSAISQQIKTLEEELEIKLLVRNKRTVKLTAAGHAFLRDAKEILARVEESKAEARRAAQEPTGSLSIGCFSGATSHFLPELIQAYRTRYPAVRILVAKKITTGFKSTIARERLFVVEPELLSQAPIDVPAITSMAKANPVRSAPA